MPERQNEADAVYVISEKMAESGFTHICHLITTTGPTDPLAYMSYAQFGAAASPPLVAGLSAAPTHAATRPHERGAGDRAALSC